MAPLPQLYSPLATITDPVMATRWGGGSSDGDALGRRIRDAWVGGSGGRLSRHHDGRLPRRYGGGGVTPPRAAAVVQLLPSLSLPPRSGGGATVVA